MNRREMLAGAAACGLPDGAALSGGPLDADIERTLAHNTPHLIFEGQPARQTLLIVFSYIDQPLGTRAHSSFLAGLDCKKLFLNPGRNHWYQDGVPGVAAGWSELLAFLTAVRRRFADHEILCLGHSMGGFAALGLGVAIGADRVLASVPEIELKLPGSLSVRYLRQTPLACADVTPLLAGNRRTAISVIVGRQAAFDMATATRLAALPLIELIEIDSNHATFPHLRDIGKLGALLAAFVENRPLRAVLAAP